MSYLKINILEERFKEVANISAVKTYVKRFDKYEIKNDCLTGTILVDLSYFDDSMTENFQTMGLDFDVTLKEGLEVNNVSLLDLDLCVVDKKGVNVKYNIEIDYIEKYDGSIIDEEVIVINEEEKTNIESNDTVKVDSDHQEKTQEELVSMHMSEQINQEYDKMLGETLKDRKDNVNITTVIENNERGFLELFNMFEAHYLKITKVYVDDKNRVLNEYNLSEAEFNENYDANNNVLTLKSYD